MQLPAIAYTSDGSRIGVLVSDLSYDGCCMHTEHSFSPRERFTLVVMTLGAETSDEVKWATNGKVGTRFVYDVN
jgi:hypothetical protein